MHMPTAHIHLPTHHIGVQPVPESGEQRSVVSAMEELAEAVRGLTTILGGEVPLVNHWFSKG